MLRCATAVGHKVIIEAARKRAHASFAAFREAVVQNRCQIGEDRLVYQGFEAAGTLTFYLSGRRLPEIDGASVNVSPPKNFDSPFLQEDHASGVVTIEKGDRRLIIDVLTAGPQMQDRSQ